MLFVSMAIALLVLAAPHMAAAGEQRTLSIYNIHTKETSTVTFKQDGVFSPEGLQQINQAMRDWRRDEATEMDPELIDLIWALHRDLGSNEPVHLISGYRSRKTNDRLRRTQGGQARNSRHILGKAADIHFPDVAVKTLRNSALVREVGGVGYYPKSGLPFVHVDTGKVRHWPRLPRQELAALFPSGETQHRPRDGRPITLTDARKAIASGKYAGPPAPVAVAETKPDSETAPVMTASLASASPITALLQKTDVTGAVPETTAPPVSKKMPAIMQLASADPLAEIRQRAEAFAAAPVAEIAIESRPEPDYDPEHPEELSYRPFAVLALMQDMPLSRDVRMIGFVAPDFENAGYLLVEPDRPIALSMRAETGIQRLAANWEFAGPAVRDLRPRRMTPRPAQPPAGKVLTASSPVGTALPAPGYNRGARAMSFSFQ